MKNKAREILTDLVRIVGYNYNKLHTAEVEYRWIDQALHSLYELIEGEILKKKYCMAITENLGAVCDEHCLSILHCENNIRNQSLSDQEKILKEIFEEK